MDEKLDKEIRDLAKKTMQQIREMSENNDMGIGVVKDVFETYLLTQYWNTREEMEI